MTQAIVVAALYKFVSLPDFEALREPLLQTLLDNGVKGTLLIAEEGINGTVSGSRAGIDGLLTWLKADPAFWSISTTKSPNCDDEQPFYRSKVQTEERNRHPRCAGVSIPTSWSVPMLSPRTGNALIADPEVLVIDTRNDYEVAIGTFERAIDPQNQELS